MNEGAIFKVLRALCIDDQCIGDLSNSCGCYQAILKLRDEERERCAKIVEKYGNKPDHEDFELRDIAIEVRSGQ